LRKQKGVTNPDQGTTETELISVIKFCFESLCVVVGDPLIITPGDDLDGSILIQGDGGTGVDESVDFYEG
jgi:hypothetical protein